MLVRREVTSSGVPGSVTPSRLSAPTCPPPGSTIHPPTTLALRTVALARYNPDGAVTARTLNVHRLPAALTVPEATPLPKVPTRFALFFPLRLSFPSTALPRSQASTRLPSHRYAT